MSRIRVLVVDDSPLARQVISAALASDAGIEVVGVASAARFAQEKMARLEVDVVTVDLEMPGIDGLSFLRAMLAVHPVPAVVVSAFTPRGSALALRALEMGAVDVVAKPAESLDVVGPSFTLELLEKVRAAAKARVRVGGRVAHPRPGAPGRGALPAPAPSPRRLEPVILLGASTGGCEALAEIIAALPPDAPPVICVQHIPALFSSSLAARLSTLGTVHVSEARTGDPLEPGRAYVAPGGRQLVLSGPGGRTLEVRDDSERHRPCIDVTFRSAAERLGARAIAALLTGMGHDGADGLAAILAAGGFTLAQDEATCVVYGMPKAAVLRGAAQVVAPLDAIAEVLMTEAQRRRQR